MYVHYNSNVKSILKAIGSVGLLFNYSCSIIFNKTRHLTIELYCLESQPFLKDKYDF